MKYMRNISVLFLVLTVWFQAAGKITLASRDVAMKYSLPSSAGRTVISLAAGMMEHDIEAVSSKKPEKTDYQHADVKISNLATADASELGEIERAGIDYTPISGKADAFMLTAREGKLYIIGADDRGTAYGILELSRLAGVSPWVWWNDVTPQRKERITVSDDISMTSVPSVRYRGIFINDEDWSLHPWSNLTHDPTAPKGSIGAATYRRLFELLLRLRANTIWPAMHECTLPFFFTPGARESADSFAIAIGTSHCEPLLRNNVGEWDKSVRGPYNFITNRDNVVAYWTERLIEAGGNENLYTIGMRGIHDGNMEGVKTMEEKVKGLQQVIDTQRNLLATHVNPDVTLIPQIFVPYKEVLDIMENGLTVPDDVTLMWCDDNYGHLTRLSDPEQQRRAGGAGIYYHLSYWGRPHDYLWLGTTQPGLIYHEMRTAYDHNARKVWIANIHDPKTASYGLELFLDMAWDINSVTASSVDAHLKGWLAREFGEENAGSLLHVMKEYYRLCAIRRPEHMGWSQVELSDRKAYPRGRSQVTDTEFSFTEMGNEADRYLESFKEIARQVDSIRVKIAPDRADAFFAQIQYPVQCAALMAEKNIEAQRARSMASGQSGEPMWNRTDALIGACARSTNAYRKIRELTRHYNDTLADGKWRHLMNMAPRDLYVFNPPILPIGLSDAECREHGSVTCPPDTTGLPDDFVALDGMDYTEATCTVSPVSMLGHSMHAVPLPKGEKLTYSFELPESGETTITIALLPSHPLDGGDLRYGIRIDDEAEKTISIREKGRSDRWKENVMRNQARPSTRHNLEKGQHTLTLTALDENIVVDQIMIDTKKGRKYYVIPTRK